MKTAYVGVYLLIRNAIESDTNGNILVFAIF